MNDLKTVSGLVKHILENSIPARNSDSNLYLQVLLHIAEQKGIDLREVRLIEFLSVGTSMGFPVAETVRRARQKIQATYPELAASERVEGIRAQNEKKYRAYALSDLGDMYGH